MKPKKEMNEEFFFDPFSESDKIYKFIWRMYHGKNSFIEGVVFAYNEKRAEMLVREGFVNKKIKIIKIIKQEINNG